MRGKHVHNKYLDALWSWHVGTEYSWGLNHVRQQPKLGMSSPSRKLSVVEDEIDDDNYIFVFDYEAVHHLQRLPAMPVAVSTRRCTRVANLIRLQKSSQRFPPVLFSSPIRFLLRPSSRPSGTAAVMQPRERCS
jgi:hypothetical protein